MENTSIHDESFINAVAEPKLKYDRIKNDLAEILRNDSVSAMVVHSKFITIGTYWGQVYVLDHSGNRIQFWKFKTPHMTVVRELSIDDHGDFIGSCSDDGRIFVFDFTSDANVDCKLNFDRPIKAFSVCPLYGKTRQLVFGSADKLVHYEKGFLGRNKSTTLHEGEGPIGRISWRSDFIVFSNEYGVRVYDMKSRERISNVPRGDSKHFSTDMYPCNIAWQDDRTFLVGWARDIKICSIRDRPPPVPVNVPPRCVKIISEFSSVSYTICGISTFGSDLLLLTVGLSESTIESLGKSAPGAARVEKGCAESEPGQKPHLRLVKPLPDQFDELSDDTLVGVREFEKCRPYSYRLAAMPSENLYYIVSPKDVACATACDEDDHIDWLLQQQFYEEAMSCAEKAGNLLRRHNFIDVATEYLDSLIGEENYDKAASIGVRVMGEDRARWEKFVKRFATVHHLSAISPYIPTAKPRLDPRVYQLVLIELLNADNTADLKKLLREWPADLYSPEALVETILDRYNTIALVVRPDSADIQKALLECLTMLYIALKQFTKACTMYLRLGDSAVFPLIEKHQLFDFVSEKMRLLLKFDREKALNLLSAHSHRIKPAVVLGHLKDDPRLQFEYLDRLFQHSPQAANELHMHDLMVRLYAEFDQRKLLPFMRANVEHVILEDALRECRRRELYDEQVFLLAKMGRSMEALRVLLEKVRDIDKAITFCREEDDSELWDRLIDISLESPAYISHLLNNVGTHINPRQLISRIPPKMEIPGLKSSLVQLLRDYQLQNSLQQGYRNILLADCRALMQSLIGIQSRPLHITTSLQCAVCSHPLLARRLQTASTIVSFFCQHSYHMRCLDAHRIDQCMICAPPERADF